MEKIRPRKYPWKPKQIPLAALRHIVYGDPKRLYSFTLGPEAQKRLSAADEAFVSAQLERGFRTLDFYKSVRCMDEPS